MSLSLAQAAYRLAKLANDGAPNAATSRALILAESALLCAAGPKQRDKLQPVVNQWIDLPPGSFKESFTNVAAAIMVINR